MSNVLAKTEPADVPIPMAFIEPPGLDTVRGRATRACMSQEEYRLYEETWKRYMKVHEEDFNDAEDTDDLHMICMEMVIQHRLEMKQLAKPSQIPTQEYDRSVRRQQTARENLAARRADRLAAKSGRGRGTNINIAVLAGGVDQAKLLEQRRQQALAQEQEEQQFLRQSRESLSGERVEVIDVQPQEPDTGGK